MKMKMRMKMRMGTKMVATGTDLYRAGFLLLFTSWFTLSAYAQVRKCPWRRRFLGLVPRFHFFAPRAVNTDYSVRWRVFPGDPWQDITINRKTFWCGLWNPNHRIRKGIRYASRSTRLAISPYRKDSMSDSYLRILNFASRPARATGASSVQFCLIRRSPVLASEVVCESWLHSVFETHR